ncbi:MAG: DUF3108 domain-containing protein [Deltaproteobacteria bacterium]
MLKSSKRLSVTFCAAFALITISLSPAAEAPINPTVPTYQPKFQLFEKGEKQMYLAHWNGLVSVATAEITTTPAIVDGKKVYQVRVQAKSSKLLDLIWKMRDTITSTFDAKAFAPSRFTFRQRENSKVVDTEARYSEFTNRWAVNRQEAGKKPAVYEFDSQNTLDPITAVYLARSIDFKVGDWLYFKIFGGKYQYLLELRIDSKEPVKLPSGKSVEAYKIIPFIQNIAKEGYANRLNEASVWISADERRLPVKISSKIFVGSVYLELIEAEQGVQSTSAEARRSPL